MHSNYAAYNMFKVDPKKHRLLLEVFDENRLVSHFIIWIIQKELFFFFKILDFVKILCYFLQNVVKFIVVVMEFWWIPNVEGLFHIRAATNFSPYELIWRFFCFLINQEQKI